jgi:hypothetical protein
MSRSTLISAFSRSSSSVGMRAITGVLLKNCQAVHALHL